MVLFYFLSSALHNIFRSFLERAVVFPQSFPRFEITAVDETVCLMSIKPTFNYFSKKMRFSLKIQLVYISLVDS